LDKKRVKRLDWSSQSPDLSPIEQLWTILDRCIRQRAPSPKNTKGLQEFLIEEWDQIGNDVIEN
jgi:transposase